jgi:hypothetical protein
LDSVFPSYRLEHCRSNPKPLLPAASEGQGVGIDAEADLPRQERLQLGLLR